MIVTAFVEKLTDQDMRSIVENSVGLPIHADIQNVLGAGDEDQSTPGDETATSEGTSSSELKSSIFHALKAMWNTGVLRSLPSFCTPVPAHVLTLNSEKRPSRPNGRVLFMGRRSVTGFSHTGLQLPQNGFTWPSRHLSTAY